MYLFSKQSFHYNDVEQYRDGVETFIEDGILLIGCKPIYKDNVLSILSKFNVTYKMYWKHDKYEDVVYEETPDLHEDDYTLNIKLTLLLLNTLIYLFLNIQHI